MAGLRVGVGCQSGDCPGATAASAYRHGPRRSARVIGMRDLLEVMWQRHSCRAAFDPHREIREADLQRMLDAARWAPSAHNLQNFEIIAVDDQQRLAELCAIQLPPMATFIRENRRQLSLSEAELLQRKTGLSASMFPESWQETDADQH